MEACNLEPREQLRIMAAQPDNSPSTPDRAPKIAPPTVRRAFTAPTKLSEPSRAAHAVPGADSVETLFVHPEAKVVSFTISKLPSSSGIGGSEVKALPWTSAAERTLAAGKAYHALIYLHQLTVSGPLSIYRVLNTGVSFLNSGNFLYHVMAKSQCWCVDRESKFVLRVREGTFYRFELSASTDEEKQKIEEFKSVLGKILQYEKTPSPFAGGYVEEPERPSTPIRRRSSQPREKAKKWRLNKVWEPEDEEHRARLRAKRAEAQAQVQAAPFGRHLLKSRRASSPITPDTEHSADSDRYAGSTEEEVGTSGDSSSVSEHEGPAEEHAESGVKAPQLKEPPRPRIIQTGRSITLPPHLTLHASPPSLSKTMPPTTEDGTLADNDAASIVSSQTTYYSADEGAPEDEQGDLSEHLDEDDTIRLPTRHKRDISEATAVPSTPKAPVQFGETEREPSDPATPTLISDSGDDVPDTTWFDAITPPDTMRLRHITTRPSSASIRPGIDPLANASLFTPSRPPSRRTQISQALIQNAYSLVIGPPAHLIALMLQIAARIVHGIPIVYGGRGRREKAPGAWESSADEEDEWDEDDYGVPLHNLRRGSEASLSSMASRNTQSSVGAPSDSAWSID